MPSHCPSCGCELPSDSPDGLCPDCLLKQGLESREPASAPPPGSDYARTAHQPAGQVPPPPDSLAPYFPQLEILELLGQGGMGAVYKARQTKLDRLVALKIIRPDWAGDPAFTERFNREARTLARLNHPHIVAVHDFGEIAIPAGGASQDRPGTMYYLLMEFVDGTNLRRLIDLGELPPTQALAIVSKLCDALQFAHDEGIVHRDIKPENILIDSKGGVKIADFGLAKLAGRSADEFTLTGTHQVMGTPRYMAPEQMEGSHAVDHRADIYSMGVVFYEMLTGQVPAGHFESPSKKVAIDVRLDEVVLRSLAREPARRYQQASQVKADVEVISGTHVAPQPASTAVGSTGSPASRSTLGRAWDAWWGERDRWFTTAVQSALVIMFLVCFVCYLSFHFSNETGPTTNGRTFRHVTVKYGVPSPWFHLETFPEPLVPWRSHFNPFASSVWIFLLGFVAYGAYWQIEKARPHAKLHWSGSPYTMFCAWAALTVFAVLWGMHPIALNGIAAMQSAADRPGNPPSGSGARPTEEPKYSEAESEYDIFGAVASGQIDRVARVLADGNRSTDLINAKSEGGRTPLMAAAEAGDSRMVAYLLLRGADERLRDNAGRSALMVAVEAGQTAAVQMLVDMRSANWSEEVQFRLKRIDPETTATLDFKSLHFDAGGHWQDDLGETALMKAAARGHAEIFRSLQTWSDHIARDIKGRTALVHAIENRQIEFLKPLFDAADAYVKVRLPGDGFVGAVDPQVLAQTDGGGATPLRLAEIDDLPEIAGRIRSYLESVVETTTRMISAGGRSARFNLQTRAQAYRGLGQTDQADADIRAADNLSE